MSAPVRLHEPVCFDNMQNQFYWIDHFLGDQIKDEWRQAFVGAGSVVVVDQQVGGIARITTGAVNGDSSRLDYNDIRILHVDQKVSMETRLKLTDLTNSQARLALFFDWSNLIDFYYTSGAANWRMECENGGATTQVDSGIVADTSYHRFRIECLSTGVHFYIDGTECGNSPITTNIPDDAADFLQPFLYRRTLENLAKVMDVDYVVVRQDI